MPSTFVAGDLEPDLLLPLTEPAESGSGLQAIDLTGASSVQLRWRRPDGTVALRPLTVVDAEGGRVRRTWDVGDTDQVGQHLAHVVITWANGETQTVPSDGGYFVWAVNAQLA